MDEARPRVLLIDDEKDIVRTFTLFLERFGYSVDSAVSGGEALAKLGGTLYHVIIFDYRLPDITGTELLRRVNDMQPDAVKVMLTGFASLEKAAESLMHGADSYLLKPVDMNEVLAVIEEKLGERAGSSDVGEEE
jgi:two-component system response regulator HydG